MRRPEDLFLVAETISCVGLIGSSSPAKGSSVRLSLYYAVIPYGLSGHARQLRGIPADNLARGKGEGEQERAGDGLRDTPSYMQRQCRVLRSRKA